MIEQNPEAVTPEIVLDRTAMLKELLDFGNGFISRSAEWRRSFEDEWRRWQRNADAIYDPDLDKKKADWQSRAVWPITASHIENAQAQLFKNEVGPRPPFQVKARKGAVPRGMPDQAENIQDLVIREREKSGYEVERNKVIADKCVYGSGFARVRFENRTDDRRIKVPDLEPMSVMDPGSIMRHMAGQARVVGYHDEIQNVVVYRGMRIEHISIWDLFPDPKSLQVQGSPIAYRYDTTWGEIVDGMTKGYYLPEASVLSTLASQEDTPNDKRLVQSDRQIQESMMRRPDRAKIVRCYELFARLPKKWVLINGEPIDDPDSLIPAVVRFHERGVVSVELNDAYDGEPQIFKDDYMPVPGRFYGRGPAEMLKDVQLVSTETVCQRLDAGSQSLRNKYAVMEKFLVDTKDLEENRIAVRIRPPQGSNIDDVNKVFRRLDMGGVANTAFIEPQEWERAAQERTSITRATLGTSGQVKDANQTLGGQEMLKQATGDKMAYIGMLSEFDFQAKVFHAYWRLIYLNYTPEDYALALGPERAATFQPMMPEQVAQDYQYYPMGIYTMENKALRQARLQQIDATFGMMPYFNRLEALRAMLQSADEDPDNFIMPEAEGIQIMAKAQQMAAQMAETNNTRADTAEKASEAKQ